eukprot:3157804-Pyramimonas_sp.AAC.1
MVYEQGRGMRSWEIGVRTTTVYCERQVDDDTTRKAHPPGLVVLDSVTARRPVVARGLRGN